ADIEVGAAVLQPRLHDRIDAFDEAQAHARKAPAEGGQRLGEQREHWHARQADEEAAFHAAAVLVDLLARAAQLARRRARAPHEEAAHRRQHRAARLALEQRHAELPLELADAAR